MKYFLLVFAFLCLPATAQALSVPECPVEIGSAYKQADSPGVYYISEGCKKRPILNSRVFFSHFDSWDDVTLTTKATLSSIPEHELSFLPWGPKRDFQNGSLIKTVTDSNVYLKVSGSLRAIAGEQAFLDMGYEWGWVEDVFPSVISMYEIKEEIGDSTTYPDGFVFKYPSGPEVYELLENQWGQMQGFHISTQRDLEAKYRPDRIATLFDTVTFEFDAGPDPTGSPVVTTTDIIASSTEIIVQPDPIPTYLISDNLVAHWTFDNDLQDVTGNGHNGSILGSINCTTAGKTGRACKILKGGNQIVVNKAPLLDSDISAGLTATGWLKYEGTKDHTFPWTVGDRNFYLEYTGDGIFHCGMRESATTPIIQTTKQALPNTQSWQFLACVYDLTVQELRFYADGSLRDTVSTTEFSGFSTAVSAGMGIGCRGPGRCDAEIKMETMDVDEIRLYNRALSNAELTTLFTM